MRRNRAPSPLSTERRTPVRVRSPGFGRTRDSTASETGVAHGRADGHHRDGWTPERRTTSSAPPAPCDAGSTSTGPSSRRSCSTASASPARRRPRATIRTGDGSSSPTLTRAPNWPSSTGRAGPITSPMPRPRRPTRRRARVYESALALTDTLARVPVHVIPCIERRFDNAPNPVVASAYGSILPAAWSFLLALRSRGLGSVWTTLHLFREREAAELLGNPRPRHPGRPVPRGLHDR